MAEGVDGGGNSTAFRPTSHMNLQSKWEWLSQQKGEPPSSTSHKKQRPPPIAPKPKLLSKMSHTVYESPVSFDEVGVAKLVIIVF